MKYKNLLPVALGISDILPRRHSLYNPSKKRLMQHFMVINSGRSGSTLLASILDNHSQLIVPPEQFVLANCVVKYKLYNYLEWLDLCSIILGEFVRSSGTMNWKLEPKHLLEKLRKLPKNERNFQNLIDHIVADYALQTNQSEAIIWGDKSPRNSDTWNLIYPAFKRKTKYIGLIRDGRDVAASIFRKNKDADLNYVIRKWNNSANIIRNFNETESKDNFLLVYYENLARYPQEEIKNICNFLNISFSESMLEKKDYLNKLGKAGKYKALSNVAKPVTSSNIGGWKEKLNEEQKNKLMPKLKNNLSYFEYL